MCVCVPEVKTPLHVVSRSRPLCSHTSVPAPGGMLLRMWVEECVSVCMQSIIDELR